MPGKVVFTVLALFRNRGLPETIIILTKALKL